MQVKQAFLQPAQKVLNYWHVIEDNGCFAGVVSKFEPLSQSLFVMVKSCRKIVFLKAKKGQHWLNLTTNKGFFAIFFQIQNPFKYWLGIFGFSILHQQSSIFSFNLSRVKHRQIFKASQWLSYTFFVTFVNRSFQSFNSCLPHLVLRIFAH